MEFRFLAGHLDRPAVRLRKKRKGSWSQCPNYGRPYFVKRSAEVMDIWTGVFGSDSSRVLRVLGGFAANAWWNDQRLQDPVGRNHFDALAIAPYFGGYLGYGDSTGKPLVSGWAPDDLFEEIFEGGRISTTGSALDQAASWVSKNAAVAQRYGVDLISYEGGQHLVGVNGIKEDPAVSKLFIDANGGPRMELAYRHYLDDWWSNGGRLFMHFTHLGYWKKYGSWGAIRIQTEPDTPKFNALLRGYNRLLVA